ncbi:MAG: ATP-binding protein [Ignavibacteriales bacterium]|nr:ATP-binding protein [Ignavibacteriales bacterium]
MRKLKTKILLILLFFSFIILLLGLVGSSFIRELAKDSKAIIQDNYKSVQYATEMQHSVSMMYQNALLLFNNQIPDTEFAKQFIIHKNKFEKNFELESKNITETGEKELVRNLNESYMNFKILFDQIKISNAISNKINLKNKNLLTYSQINDKFEDIINLVNGIYNINMEAILRKNLIADNTAHRVSTYMIITGTVSLIISLLSLFYFPGYLVKPIHQLTEKINEITRRNYNQQLNIKSLDEIGDLAKSFNHMAERLREYEQNNLHQLLIEKKRVEAILQNMNDAVLVIDENKIIVSINKTALELFGLKDNEIIGKYAPDVATHNDLIREIIKDIIPRFDGNTQAENKPIQIFINNKESFFSKEVIEIKLAENGFEQNSIGYVLVLKNITSFEERDTAKTNLIATVSHELKTPLSSINLSLKLLENDKIGTVNEEQKKILQAIRQQTVRLSKMVNELLDFSQTESGNIKLNITTVKPEDIIEYAVLALVMISAEKNIQLNTKIEENLPKIQADIEKTVWVLVNLINNAIRYTNENGDIQIVCRKENNFVIFSVIDKGAGIAPEDQEKIFKKFIQVGSNPKGRGLGLAISKEFVLSQGGNIWLKSEIGIGSNFSFSIPV